MENEQEINAENTESIEKTLSDAENLLNADELLTNEETKTDENTETHEETQTSSEVKTKTEDPDHGEKSKMGRKIKYLEDRFNKFDQKMDTLLNKIDPKEPEVIPGEDIDLPTGKDVVSIVEKVMEKREKQNKEREITAQKQYQGAYMDLLDEAVGDDNELKALLIDPKSPFNKTSNEGFFGDPAKDLLVNISKAQKYLRAGGKILKANVKGKESTVANGVEIPGHETKYTGKKVDVSKWTPDEQAMAESGLFSDEELLELAKI